MGSSRIVAEQPALELEGVQERPRDMRHEIRLGAVEVHDAYFRSFDRRELCMRWSSRSKNRQKEGDDAAKPTHPLDDNSNQLNSRCEGSGLV